MFKTRPHWDTRKILPRIYTSWISLTLIALVSLSIAFYTDTELWAMNTYVVCEEKCEARKAEMEELKRVPEKYSQEWWTMYCNDNLLKCK